MQGASPANKRGKGKRLSHLVHGGEELGQPDQARRLVSTGMMTRSAATSPLSVGELSAGGEQVDTIFYVLVDAIFRSSCAAHDSLGEYELELMPAVSADAA